jgi:hypothetical protein
MLLFPLIISQALLVFTLSPWVLQSCKPIWDVKLLPLFNFHILCVFEMEPLHIKASSCKFIYWQSLRNFCNRQICMSRIILKTGYQAYLKMTSSAYQNVIKLIVYLTIKICPSVFMNVAMWGHSSLRNQILCGKIYYSDFVVIASLVDSRSVFSLELFSLPVFHWNHLTKFPCNI